MNLKDKVVIVTGAARGIGAAMASRFAGEGARVVVADLSAEAAQEAAAAFGGLGVGCDVTREANVQALVAETEARFGPVDLFCSNAGVCLGEGDHAASASNTDWQLCWDVHVMAHVYAARAVLPGMIARGDGYLLQMASASGLLSQIGDAAYSATKHAAVGFAESLAISHADQGIKVSVICPLYVATPMLGYTDASEADDLPDVLTPEQVADAVVKGVARETFLILPHPQVAKFIQHKSSDYDRWLGAMRTLRGRIVDEIGSTRLEDMHKLV
jgi:NAD(P)-dependent dehydrogenase (short-subunit alcohol dehydrogenase family)